LTHSDREIVIHTTAGKLDIPDIRMRRDRRQQGRVRDMKTSRYVDLRAAHRLIGAHYPRGAASLAQSLEEYLTYAKDSGDPLPERLLAHNVSGKRNRAACEFAPIDADVVFTLDCATNHLNRELKDYRVHTQFSRLPHERRVVLHLLLQYPDRTRWAIHAPLQALMKGFGDPEEGYQCYSHSIGLEDPTSGAITETYYCGITSRNWLKRMAEHLGEVRSGSNRTFHRAWREFQGRADVILNSELVVLNQTFEAAMGWEEYIVDRFIAEGRSLNMIPGGFKGLKFLHELGHLNRIDNISLQERESAIVAYAKKHPRAGVPNTLISGLWQNDAFYAKVITGRSNTLSLDQVTRIRALNSEGMTPEQIVLEVGARNVEQVRRVLIGRTYSRLRDSAQSGEPL
jgi:hypothetical protein